MPLPSAGTYDSIYDQLLISEGNRLKNQQLEYGTYDPNTNTFTDGSRAAALSQDYGFGDSAALNPYNRLATLNRSQAADRTDNMNAAGEGGNLMSGGYGVRRDNLLWGQGAAQNQLSSDYLSQLANLRQAALGAQQSYDANISAGWADALERKLRYEENNPKLEPPAVGSAAGGAAAFGGALGTFGETTTGNLWTKAENLYSKGSWGSKTYKDPQGEQYRIYTHNGQKWRVYPSGRRELVGTPQPVGNSGTTQETP